MDSDHLEDSSEALWVERFRSTGRGEHFECLYQACRRKVYGICRRLLRDGEEAQDVTHEAFLRAYQRFATLEGSNFSGWVCRIASNLCLNRIRDQKTRERVLEAASASEVTGDAPPVEDLVILEEEIQTARQILEDLRPEHRRVLLLRYVEGFTYPEIEALTGFEQDQLRSHLQNAKRNFRIRWEARRAVAGSTENGS